MAHSRQSKSTKRKRVSMRAMVIAVATVLLFIGSMAISAEAENTETQKIDTSKNPITGTETVTKKYKKKMKSPHGSQQTVEVTEKTKQMRDGTFKQSADVEVDATSR